MGRRQGSTIWEAEPHTLAKIAILKSYLTAWFQIFGRSHENQDLLYIDGFAGPGHYTNSSQGSPVAAVVAAREALAASGAAWKAKDVFCVFIEANRRTADYLREHLQPFMQVPRLHVHVIHDSFAQGFELLGTELPQLLHGQMPRFVFVDPFGATGAPFSTVREVLSRSTSEVLMNLDADGLMRILRAGPVANGQAQSLIEMTCSPASLEMSPGATCSTAIFHHAINR